MIDKLNELCMWLSHQKGMMSQDYAKELAKIIVKLNKIKPLSDEEILNEWLGNDRNFYYFARAIEERHGIK